MGSGIIGYLIFIGLIYVLQYVLQLVLASIGLDAITIFIIVEFCISVLFAYIMYPAPYRKNAWRDPKFHMNIAIFFAVFVILQLVL